jgi:hypothetical protein
MKHAIDIGLRQFVGVLDITVGPSEEDAYGTGRSLPGVDVIAGQRQAFGEQTGETGVEKLVPRPVVPGRGKGAGGGH